LMMEGSGSIPLTNGSRSRSGRPQNFRSGTLGTNLSIYACILLRSVLWIRILLKQIRIRLH